MHLKTLGGLSLEGSSYRGLKPLLMLAYVSLEGPRPRRELAELFWMDAKNPRDSLSVALRQLRKAAGNVIEADKERVWANVACDATEVLELLDVQESERALVAYAGPFLEGLDLSLGEELEEWVFGTREFLASRVRQALLDLAEQALVVGRFEDGAKRAEAAYLLRGAPEIGPWLLQRMYRVLMAVGNPRASDIKRQTEELGIVLEPEDTEEPAESNRAPKLERLHNLPARNTSFVGRDLELVEIANSLEDPTCRLLTLSGPGGVGKTSLALQAAQEQLRGQQFTDGIFYVPLDTLTSPRQIPLAIADAIALQIRSQEEALLQLQRYLRTKSMLLLLDNYEHLIEGVPLTAKLLSNCPKLKVLVTSRERLNLAEESLLPLEGLSLPRIGIKLENAHEYDAVKFFALRAKRVQRDFTLTEEELPSVLKLCQFVGGSPLGIEMATSWLRVMPVTDIGAEIKHNTDLLASSVRDKPQRHHSIQAVFEHSWELLNHKEQEVLCKLAVFRGGFRRNASTEITGVTIPILAALVDKSLLCFDEFGRYDFHPLLQQFCQMKLKTGSIEEKGAREKHAAFYLQLLKETVPHFLGDGQAQALEILKEEKANLYQAWDWAVARRDLEALIIASPSLRLFSDRTAQYHEGIEHLERAEARLDEDQQPHLATLGRILADLGTLYFYIGDLQRAIHTLQRSLRLLRPINDQISTRDALSSLGGLLWRKGDYLEAKLTFGKSLEISQTLRDERGIANGLGTLGMVEIDLGNFTLAETYLQKSLELCRKLGHHARTVMLLKDLGELARKTGRLKRAEGLFQEALTLAERIDFRRVTPNILVSLSVTLFDLGDYTRTIEFGRHALAEAERIDNPGYKALALVALGRTTSACGDALQAQTHLTNLSSEFS